ncbi:MAG TPA: hypothetical protein VIH18_15630 [Candidatus Binatia bacterium]|jgi:hypothetical protein
MARAETRFDKLTTLGNIEGQSTPSDGPRAVIPSECKGSKLRKISPFGRNDKARFFAPLRLGAIKFLEVVLLSI